MEEERIKEARRLNRLISKAVEFRKQQRDDEYVQNQAHYEGLHWRLANVEADSPFIIKSDINHLKNAVDIRFGSLFANTYYGILKPLSERDIDVIEDLNILYKDEWYRLKLDSLIQKAVKNGGICDNGYIEFGFDADTIVGGTGAKREGVITADVVDTASIYLDPSANSIDECNYMVKKMNLTMEELERDFPEWYQKLKRANVKGGAAKSEETGNIFVGRDYTTNQDNIVAIDAVYEKYVTEVEVPAEENKPENDLVEIPLEPNAEQEQEVELVKVTRVKISYIYKEIVLGVNNEYPFEEFPIVPFQWEPIPQSPYGVPLLRGLTVPQKVANLIESSINNIAIHYTIPTWVISDDSGLDVDDVAKLINALGVVWKVTDIDNAIKQLEPPKINADIVGYGQTFVNYIKEYAGATGAYQGNIGTAGSTAEGTIEAIGRATIIDNNPLAQIEDFVERLTNILIKFMVRYYAGDTITIREDLEDNKYRFRTFVMDSKFDDVNYDFDVDLGSRSKNDKNRQYNLMKDIYQLQNQYKDRHPVINVTDIVKAAQLDNYNEMKNRLDNMTDEALEEKASMIVRLMEAGNTKTPNGQPLVDAQTLSDGIMDVLNDDNDLSVVEGILQTYEQYQEEFTKLKQSLAQSYDNAMMNNVDNSQNM